MTSIEIKIERATIEKWGNEIHAMNYVMRELKAQGAPIEGGLFPVRIASGTVTFAEDIFGDLVVTWSE